MENFENGVVATLGNTQVKVAGDQAARDFIAKVIAPNSPPTITIKTVGRVKRLAPAIGAQWEGGIYAGIMRGRDGAPDYYLIVGDELTGKGGMSWNAAMALFSQSGKGEDWSLPFRKEQALCFANVPELFEQKAYWSCEPYAGGDASAWYQSFHLGTQSHWRKDYEFRARAVRRIVIE